MRQLKINIATILIGIAMLCTASKCLAYQVWLGTHKWEGSGADNLDQWDMVIDKIDGINYVLLDSRTNRPAGEGATANDWRTMIAPIDQSIPGMAEISRSQYSPASNRSLAARMENEFSTARNNGDYEIDIIMLYDEARNGTVWKYDLQDVEEVRDWLDNNGHADVSIVFRLTNNDQERLRLAQLSIVDGVLIEASATRWVEDRFNIHTLLQDLWTDPSTSSKNIYFQIPRSESPGSLSQRNGIPSSPINQYVETRRALWAIKDLMGDAFMQSDQAVFLVCNYGDTYDTYPETENNDTRYVDTKSGLALSLIEQRAVFEGRTGLVDEDFCKSYERTGTIVSDDLNILIPAAAYDAESDPGNDNRVRDAGSNIGYIVDGTWVRYNDFNFTSDGFGGIRVSAATPKTRSKIEVRIRSATGPLLGTIDVPNTGNWGNYQNTSKKISSRNGTHDLYLVFKGGSGGLLNLQSFTILPRDATISSVKTENSSNNLVYSGAWSTQNNSNDSGGSMKWSKVAGHSVKYTFTGDRVKVAVREGTYGGTYRVLLDGNIVENSINTQTTPAAHQQVIYDSGRLFTYGQHTIELLVLGSGNVMFDFFETEE